MRKGNFSAWWEDKCRQDRLELEQNQRLKGEIRRLDQSARQKAIWSDRVEKSKTGAADKGYVGHKAAKMMKRAKAVESRRTQAVQEKEKLLKNIEKVDPLALHPLRYHSDLLVRLEDVSVYYGENRALGPVSLSVERGERVALRGKNGCGKSTLLKLIQRAPLAHDGSLFLPAGIILSTVPQDFSFLQGDLRDFARNADLEESLFKAILRKLNFPELNLTSRCSISVPGRRKKCCWRKACARAPTYIYGTSRLTILIFFPACRLNS